MVETLLPAGYTHLVPRTVPKQVGLLTMQEGGEKTRLAGALFAKPEYTLDPSWFRSCAWTLLDPATEYHAIDL